MTSGCCDTLEKNRSGGGSHGWSCCCRSLRTSSALPEYICTLCPVTSQTGVRSMPFVQVPLSWEAILCIDIELWYLFRWLERKHQAVEEKSAYLSLKLTKKRSISICCLRRPCRKPRVASYGLTKKEDWPEEEDWENKHDVSLPQGISANRFFFSNTICFIRWAASVDWSNWSVMSSKVKWDARACFRAYS